MDLEEVITPTNDESKAIPPQVSRLDALGNTKVEEEQHTATA